MLGPASSSRPHREEPALTLPTSASGGPQTPNEGPPTPNGGLQLPTERPPTLNGGLQLPTEGPQTPTEGPQTPTGAMPRASRATMPPGPPPIVLEHVSRSFGKVLAVEDLSLTAAPGSLLGVIGPSGSGKTTTIRLMLGALKPDRGVIRVLGEDPRHFGRRTRERIGYMPQSFVLYPELTARENVN